MYFSKNLVKLSSGNCAVFSSSAQQLVVYNLKNGKAKKKIVNYTNGSFSIGEIQDEIPADDVAVVQDICVVRQGNEFYIN